MGQNMQEHVARILASARQPNSPIRPTLLYNEGWMLRLLLDYLADNPTSSHPFRFLNGARWFSEALLFSAFLARYRRPPDELAEGWTNADGVVGHFTDPNTTPTGELRLFPQAKQFVVIEAKIFSGLSTGVTRCPGYDQAARNLACMAAVLSRAELNPRNVDRLAFFVVAPASQIKAEIFGQRVTKPSILQRVQDRVSAYAGERDNWFNCWFLPTLDAVELRLFSWEEALQNLPDGFQHFYESCVRAGQGGQDSLLTLGSEPPAHAEPTRLVSKSEGEPS